MINTTKGPMDEKLLRKVEGVCEDNENHRMTFVEYYDGDELVHRSADLQIKKGVEVKFELGELR